MNRLLGCLNKDRKEFLRRRINLICLGMLLLCIALVLGGTIAMPLLLSVLEQESTMLLAGDTTLNEFLQQFFPQKLSASLGIFASDIGVFYNLVMVFLTYDLLSGEMISGKMIFPICAGHKKAYLLLSKEIVYSVLMSVPVFPGYMLYYLIGGRYLAVDCSGRHVLLNAMLMMASVFFTVAYTIVLSVLMRNKYMPLFFMVSTILVGPDLLSFLAAGRFFPTYILTYLYRFENEPRRVIIPVLVNCVLLILLNSAALTRGWKINVDTRR